MRLTFRSGEAALLSFCALSACGFGASYPNFAHTPAFRIEGVRSPLGGGASQRVVIYRDGAKLRVETSGGRSIVVFDQANNAYALTSLPPPPPTPPVNAPVPPVQAITPAPTPATTLPLAPPPNVIGMAIRVADSQAPQPLETPWAALTPSSVSGGGGCTVANERGREWRATGTSLGVANRTACITLDGIVLRESEGNKVIFQAVRLDRGPQPASLFGVPAGYQRSTPAAVVESAATPTTVVANTGPAG